MPGVRTPVPVIPIARLGLDPFEVTERLPLTVALLCGVKVRLNATLCPGTRVVGNVSPVKLKPVPMRVACEIVRFEPPELLRLSAKV